MALDVEFQSAVDSVQQLTQRPSNEELLSLYGLFKQATEGDNGGVRPTGFDFKGMAKFDAWESQRGKSSEQAKTEYIRLATDLRQRYA